MKSLFNKIKYLIFIVPSVVYSDIATSTVEKSVSKFSICADMINGKSEDDLNNILGYGLSFLYKNIAKDGVFYSVNLRYFNERATNNDFGKLNVDKYLHILSKVDAGVAIVSSDEVSKEVNNIKDNLIAKIEGEYKTKFTNLMTTLFPTVETKVKTANGGNGIAELGTQLSSSQDAYSAALAAEKTAKDAAVQAKHAYDANPKDSDLQDAYNAAKTAFVTARTASRTASADRDTKLSSFTTFVQSVIAEFASSSTLGLVKTDVSAEYTKTDGFRDQISAALTQLAEKVKGSSTTATGDPATDAIINDRLYAISTDVQSLFERSLVADAFGEYLTAIVTKLKNKLVSDVTGSAKIYIDEVINKNGKFDDAFAKSSFGLPFFTSITEDDTDIIIPGSVQDEFKNAMDNVINIINTKYTDGITSEQLIGVIEAYKNKEIFDLSKELNEAILLFHDAFNVGTTINPESGINIDGYSCSCQIGRSFSLSKSDTVEIRRGAIKGINSINLALGIIYLHDTFKPNFIINTRYALDSLVAQDIGIGPMFNIELYSKTGVSIELSLSSYLQIWNSSKLRGYGPEIEEKDKRIRSIMIERNKLRPIIEFSVPLHFNVYKNVNAMLQFSSRMTYRSVKDGISSYDILEGFLIENRFINAVGAGISYTAY